MYQRIFQTFLIVLLTSICFACAKHSAKSPLVGTWRHVFFDEPNKECKYTSTFTFENEKVEMINLMACNGQKKEEKRYGSWQFDQKNNKLNIKDGDSGQQNSFKLIIVNANTIQIDIDKTLRDYNKL